MKKDIDVLGIGNAIVDNIFHVDENFLTQRGYEPGVMTLVDDRAAHAVREALVSHNQKPVYEEAGGSTANTIAGIASFGGKAAFVGKIAQDNHGDLFSRRLKEKNIIFNAKPLLKGCTATCTILVTPNAERTMFTNLGVANLLDENDIDEALVHRSHIVYMEGFLWDSPHAQKAFLKAKEEVKKHAGLVAFSFSDPFCVARHKKDFMHVLLHVADIAFGNEHEMMMLFDSPNIDSLCDTIRSLNLNKTVIITRSALGSRVWHEEEFHDIFPVKPPSVVDTTGAGDLFAAGFLHGITAGQTIKQCGFLGSLAASEAISHDGARPHTPLNALAKTGVLSSS